MKPLFTCAALLCFMATSAQAGIKDLVAGISENCRRPPKDAPVPEGYGVLSVTAMRSVLLTEFPLSSDALLKGPDALARRTAELVLEKEKDASSGGDWSDDDKTLYRYNLIVTAWSAWPKTSDIVPGLEGGGVRIESTSPDTVQPDILLTRILQGDDAGIRIICGNPAEEGAKSAEEERTGSTLVIVQAAGDLPEANLADKTFAEISATDDRQARVQTWAVKAAVAREWPEITALAKLKPRIYVAIDRQGENDPEADGYVDNVDFGVQGSGQFAIGPPDWLGYYALSARYGTDMEFDSKVYAAELSIDPPLPARRYIRGYGRVGSGEALEVDFKWRAHLVADWMQVDDPGEKASLVDQAEYVRLGYDAGFKVRAGLPDKRERLLLSVDYAVRDGRTKDGGDAQFFNASLRFLAKPDTRWSFGLSYDRGENLQSFESSEVWKLIFGARF